MSQTRSRVLLALAVIGLQTLWALLLPPRAFGAEGCTVTFCSAPPLSCTNRGYTPGGVSNCGTVCNSGTFNNYCQSTSAATCTNLSAPSTKVCGEDCTYTKYLGSCIANPSLPCGTSTAGPGSYSYCPSIACTATASACPTSYAPYGFVLPGDPDYGFPAVKDAGGKKAYPDPDTKNFLGLAAKGNVVIGDYTSEAFRTNVVPKIKPKTADNPGSKTQAYVIDPTDAGLGYYTGSNGLMNDAKGRPLFDGNYDQQDKDGILPGTKLDDTPRKFYESTLEDATFKSKLSMPTSGTMTIDAVLFTNHALTGLVPTSLTVNGSMVSRDDGLVYNGAMTANHDLRLFSGTTAQQLVLPLAIKRPFMVSWKACAKTTCD